MSLHYYHHLTIGLAGKREDDRLLKAIVPLKKLFSALDKHLLKTDMRLLTGFADGCDLEGANLWTTLFPRSKTSAFRKIGAVLPFHAEDFKKTLEFDKYKYMFDQLYPLCDQKLELDGAYAEGKDKAEKNRLNKAYRLQVKVLLHVSDVLVAVTAYDAKNDPGSTLETIFLTLSAKKPVIHFDLRDHRFYLYYQIEDWFNEKRPALKPEEVIALLFSQPAREVMEKTGEGDLDEGVIFFFRKIAWTFYEPETGSN